MANYRRRAGRRGMGAVALSVVGQPSAPFDYQWTAPITTDPSQPNGVPVVVQSVQFPDGIAQVVGVVRAGAVPDATQVGTGWKPIAALATGPDGSVLNIGCSVARYTNIVSSGQALVFYIPGTGAPNTSSAEISVYAPGMLSGAVSSVQGPGISQFPGWYSRSISKVSTDATGQAYLAAYQWGLKKLASMSSTVSQVATAQTPTLSSGAAPTLATAPAGSSWELYAGLGAAALGAWWFLK
jgi:hypothetical protein